jgi:hypothetical protein
MDKVIQRIYVKLNPKTKKVMTSCTLMEGYTTIYVSNYTTDQEQMRKDYERGLGSQN